MQPRLLLSTQRSGSHFLKSLLESRFTAVVCSGEVLEEPFETQSPVLPGHPEIARFWIWYAQQATAGAISTAPSQRIPHFETYLTQLTTLTQPNDLVIDIKYNCAHSLSGYEDTDHGSTHFTAFIKSRKIPVLHLIRKNILKILVSHELARRTGIYHRSTETAIAKELPKIRLDAPGLLRAIEHSSRLTRDYREHFEGYPHYEEVVYEELVRAEHLPLAANPLRALTHFLGKPPHESNPTAVWSKKTTPDDPSEIVENWNEISRLLGNTEHGWMVHPPLLAAA